MTREKDFESELIEETVQGLVKALYTMEALTCVAHDKKSCKLCFATFSKLTLQDLLEALKKASATSSTTSPVTH